MHTQGCGGPPSCTVECSDRMHLSPERSLLSAGRRVCEVVAVVLQPHHDGPGGAVPRTAVTGHPGARRGYAGMRHGQVSRYLVVVSIQP